MPSIVGEIAVISSSNVGAQSRHMSRESQPAAASVVRNYAPVTPDGPVMSRSVSNGDDVTLRHAVIRLWLLVYFECRANGVELRWTMVESIRRGGRLVVVAERSVGLEVFVVRTGATADLGST